MRSGISATYLIRKNAQLRHIPIIAMTAFTHELLDDAIKAGCNEALVKPFDLDELKGLLNKLLHAG